MQIINLYLKIIKKIKKEEEEEEDLGFNPYLHQKPIGVHKLKLSKKKKKPMNLCSRNF